MRRIKELENFAHNSDADIPPTIGVKRFDTGVQGKVDVQFLDPRTGRVGRRHMADPANRAVVLAFPATIGKVDLLKPCIARVKQNFSLRTKGESVFAPLPAALETGLVFGRDRFSPKLWVKTLENWLLDCGFHSYALLTPCCVVCYKDGKQRFIRNFEKDFEKKGGVKKENILENVVGVRRTPFSLKIVPLKALTPSGKNGKNKLLVL
jgi:hypothetical protein